MPCARMGCVVAAVFLLLVPFLPVFAQEWDAVGCDLPALYQGIDVKAVCSRLGIGYRSTYGPDRTPWLQIADAGDCDRVRGEVMRLLSGAGAPTVDSSTQPELPANAPSAAGRAETPLEKWLRENGYSSMDEAEADRRAAEKKWRQERETQERFDRLTFEGRMRMLEQELRQRIARDEALIAAELERKKRAAQAVQEEAGTIPAEAWEKQLAKWKSDLAGVNREIEATRQALLKLVRAQEADVKLFNQWQREAQDGFERSKGAIIDLALDLGLGLFVESPNGWVASHARDLQARATPEALEEYRRLFSLIQRLKESRATRDFASFAAREGQTEAEVLEMARDGIGQLSGLLGLDNTPVGKVWKYGSLFFDQAYNLTALYQVWRNAGILEQDSAAMSEANQRLSERLKRQMERQQDLVRKIEAGESIDFK